jgi:hypothetical protein
VTHLSPVDPALLSDAGERKALGDSARHGDLHGQMTLGTDLMQILAGRRSFPGSCRSVVAGRWVPESEALAFGESMTVSAFAAYLARADLHWTSGWRWRPAA